MDKKLLWAELFGTAAIGAGAWLSRGLYSFCGGELLGILFGAVNGSIWEQCKTLLLPYLLWGAAEAMCLRLKFHRFVPAKTIGLYLTGLLYIALRLAGLAELLCAAAAVSSGLAASYFLYSRISGLRALFAPSVAMLFLFFSLYFSLTVFPPENKLFIDPASGVYGIVPNGYDYGAVELSADIWHKTST